MLAETAELAVVLKLKDQLTGGLTAAQGKLAGLEASASGVAAGGMTRLQTATAGVGTALGHAGNQLKSLATGLGLAFGAVAGIGIVGFFKTGIEKAQAFGAEVIRLQALTGGTAEAMSTLAAGLEHFGVGADVAQRLVGFLEKNVGLLAARKGGIADFEKTWSLSLTDANGKVKSANDLILTTADYYNNRLIPASEKAAALSKLYGRSWQDLIPVLSAGRTQLAAAEAEAAKLGLTLTSANMGDLIKLRDATRLWGDALGGLQLQIGLAVVPALTDLANAATTFVSENRTGIVAGFKSLLDVARQIGGAIKDVVIPAISAIGTAWGAIPGPLQELLVGGFALNKAAGWLFGTSPLSLLTKGLGGALGTRGGTPANPVFVSDVTGGIGGKLGGAAGAAEAGAAGILGPGLGIAAAMAIAPFVMYDLIPQLFPGRAQLGAGAGSQPAYNTAAGVLPSQTVAMMQGLMPNYITLLKQAGGTPIVPAGALPTIIPPGGEHSGTTVEGAIFRRGITNTGRLPTENAVAATLTRNHQRVMAALQSYRAGERQDLQNVKSAIDRGTAALIAKQFNVRVLGAATGFGEHSGVSSSGSSTVTDSRLPSVNVRVNVSNRQNETAQAISRRIGPTPAHAGAQ